MPRLVLHSDRTIEDHVLDLRRKLALALTFLVLTTIVSTIGFVVLDKNSGEPLMKRVFMGLWDTLNLVSTVGSLPLDMSTGQRAWALLVIIFGLGAVVYGFGTLQGLLSGGDVRHVYGRQKMQRTLDKLSNHIILCGYGGVGRQVAREVSLAKKDLLIIEMNENSATQADEDGFLVIQSDCTNEAALKQAGVERAAGLIAALNADAANVYLILIARELNPDMRIVTRADRTDTRSTMLRAGADRVIVPGDLAGHQLSHLILKPQVSEFIAGAYGEGDYDFIELRASEYPAIIGKTLQELDLPVQADAVVISLLDSAGKQTFNPPASYILNQDDTLIIVCGEDALERIAGMG